MALELYTRGMIKFYEEYKALMPAGQIGVDELLFGVRDESLDSNVRLDQFIHTPYAVAYRGKNNESHLRHYEAGSGEVFDVPRASEKTPIGEDLKDSLVAGMEGNSRHASNFAAIMRRITNQHISAHNVTKWKQSLDVLRTGTFQARGIGGNDIGLDINFNRDGANDLTADFSGVSFDEALAAFHDQLNAQGASKENRILIAGSSWLKEFSKSSDVRSFMDANNENVLLQQDMNVRRLMGAYGLYIAARYRAPNVIAPTWICEFSPETPYLASNGASSAPFVPDDEAFMFVLGANRWKVIRGVDVLTGRNQSVRQSGDIVFDAYHENDPVVDFARSQSRHLYLPGNINHSVRSTGSNFTA